jgi:hypothetical protein
VLYSTDSTTRKATRLGAENKPVTVDFIKDMVSSDSKCQPASLLSGSKISNLHASAVIDLNMDCRPDLWLETTNASGQRIAETYFLQSDGKFCLVAANTMVGTTLNPLKSSSFSFFDLLRNGNNNAILMDDMNRLHIFNNIYNIPNPQNAANPLCTNTENLDPVTKKHKQPYDGFDKLGTQFTQVICVHPFLSIELLLPGGERPVR